MNNLSLKLLDNLNDNCIATSLNDLTHNLKFHFCEDKFESSLKFENFAPIFFNNNAGGVVAGGSYNWIKSKHINKSVHEPATIGAFAFIQKNFWDQIDTIFDVGALYGYFSLISKSMFPQATVFSFEMNPISYQALCQNINVNKHLQIPATRCVNIGLSDHTVFQKKVSVHNFMLEENEEGESIIDIVSIDDFCRISGFKPSLIKIDVEGYQAKILPGAMKTIETKKPIIILEFDSKQQLNKFGTTNKLITKPLFDLGYRCYWCKEQRNFNGGFQQLNYNDLSQEHEINSLSIFIP
ncbi:methyltransferase FkbM family protein [Chondrocystis sp. NIES-4102]|nr:methyltransferase FkbM family protein [Chondrocystis sp. NIES-4102]